MAHLRSYDRRRDPDELQPGTIISAPHHTQARSGNIPTNNRNMSFSDFGVVHSKYRKMIILETWGEHCICLPLYSYRGRGLEGRRDIAEEYISVRDDSETFWEWELSESKAGVLTAIRDPTWPMWRTFITGRTVVKLTEKLVHSYTDSCSVEGHLNEADFRRLYRIYIETVKRKEKEILGLKPDTKKGDEELEEGEISS
ncbi:hypothetical protein EDB81DRAFT_939812 [Dactylonectria macrodidyma]|uniref:DUF6590 domain-containing protein n=1 Tax=Dactylonectria macrodidyma TaxID=307937 RepID=A0A9P9JMH8_9HYPO|nr:hypothetical protein EDB81DRAFT_939812 [Dactylonectria macrodidyma]